MARRMAGLRRLAILILLLGAAAIYAFAPRPAAAPQAGMVRATEIRVAPEVSGRLARLRVKPGDAVRAGDVLAELDNPELAAALVEARAAVIEAKAERDRVYAGVRQEQVQMLAREIEKAQAALTLAEQQYVRVSTLAANQNAPRQQFDQATSDLARSRSILAAARLRHAEAKAGPMAEERAIADAQVVAAEASAVVLQRRLEKTALTAPTDGIVRVVVAELGEAITPGRPILTLERTGERWLTFTLREDLLAGATVGGDLTVLAADGRKLPGRVSELRGLGEFATWRAARAVGDHDLNTFLLRVETGAPAGLEPGMTVWLPAR